MSTGRLFATYKAGAVIRKAPLWNAITKAGFTPVKIETDAKSDIRRRRDGGTEGRRDEGKDS